MVNLSGYFDKMVVALPQNSKIEVASFEDGFSNHVYRLDWDGSPQWVLRVPGLDESAFFINRQCELQVVSMAAQARLSPELLWHDDEGAFACRFVPQPSCEWTVVHSTKNIERIAKALASAHQLSPVEHQFCIYRVIEHYLQGIAGYLSVRPELAVEYAYLKKQLDSLDRLTPTQASVLCHNDANPKNFLIDDQALWLIDWEYAGMGDPLFDLAVVSRSHNLTLSQRQVLIQAYQPALEGGDTLWRLEQYGLAYALREMAWLLLKHLTSPEDPDAHGFYYEFKGTPTLNPFPIAESTI